MDPQHKTSDLQSLMLTKAAIQALKSDPDLVGAVLATLAHWDRSAPTDSKPLRDEWRDIVASGQWQRALSMDDHGQELRQASPLSRALSPKRRLEIIRACKGRS